jgi:hypothetical protein
MKRTKNIAIYAERGIGYDRCVASLLDLRRMTTVWSLVSWILPLIVSFFFVDPQTKAYIINYWVFKLLMASLLFGVTYAGYQKIASVGILTIKTPHTFLAINVIGDALVLLLLFGYPLISWLTTILPIYIMVIYGWYVVRR